MDDLVKSSVQCETEKNTMWDGYICGVTGLPCCGCSFYCGSRKPMETVN